MTVHEKKSITLYLSESYNVLRDLPTKFTASAEWNKKFDKDEKERKFAEWKAKKDAEAKGEVYIPQKSTRGNVAGKLNQSDGKEEDEPTATPAKLTGSPSTKIDKPAPAKGAPVEAQSTSSGTTDGLQYEIGGRGKDGGNEGKMLIFTVTFKLDGNPVSQPQKEDLVVHVDSPGGATQARLNIMGGTGGAYHIGLTPGVAGQWWFDFVWRGIWCPEPFMLPIKNRLNKLPDHPYTGAERKAAGATAKSGSTSSTASAPTVQEAKPTGATAKSSSASPTASAPAVQEAKTSPKVAVAPKEPSAESSICSGRTAEMIDEDIGSFTITAKDSTGEIIKGDFNFDVQITGPDSVRSKLTNNGDGSYLCNFGPASNGEYQVEVTYKGKLIHNGSWIVRVLEAMAEINFEEVTILFHATDKTGNPKTSGGDLSLFKVVTTGDDEVEIIDLEDGRYTLDYHVVPGHNSIDVQYQEESLSGFPITFSKD